MVSIHSLLESATVFSKLQYWLKCTESYINLMVLHNFTHRLNRFMCVCVFVHTGVTLMFITEHKAAVEHSGCAERYIRPRSNRERHYMAFCPVQNSVNELWHTVLNQPSTVHTATHAAVSVPFQPIPPLWAVLQLLSSTAVCNSVSSVQHTHCCLYC